MRRLIVCNDGTWNSPDDKDRGKIKPTNIIKISRAIKPVDEEGISQIVFYDEGVGTGFGEKLIGGITGFGISKNILDSYRFLSHNYQEGDEIYLFGFSRGAYTSRSLAGLIDKIGLVEKDDVFYLSRLYDLYKDESSNSEVEQFYSKYDIQCYRPRIRMIGVFDTVGALGIPIKFIDKIASKFDVAESMFHKVDLMPTVDYAYHALAIDERRKPFAPSIWSKVHPETKEMEQRWFAGVHSNIGGGYNPDSLANITLQYIVNKAKLLGLVVDESYLSFYSGDIKTKIRSSMSLKYRVLGENIRQITLNDNTNQEIDESVTNKIKSDDDYDPSNIPK